MSTEIKCPPGKIFNPRTRRCVDKNGKSGKEAADLIAKGAKIECHAGELFNPISGRCVSATSAKRSPARPCKRLPSLSSSSSSSPKIPVVIVREKVRKPRAKKVAATSYPLVVERPHLIEESPRTRSSSFVSAPMSSSSRSYKTVSSSPSRSRSRSSSFVTPRIMEESTRSRSSSKTPRPMEESSRSRSRSSSMTPRPAKSRSSSAIKEVKPSRSRSSSIRAWNEPLFVQQAPHEILSEEEEEMKTHVDQVQKMLQTMERDVEKVRLEHAKNIIGYLDENVYGREWNIPVDDTIEQHYEALKKMVNEYSQPSFMSKLWKSIW